MTAAVWEIPPAVLPEALALARELHISPLTARLLLNRGINTTAAAEAFMQPDGDNLAAPETIPGLQAARDRLVEAVKAGEKILIYGDYDADGLTATAIMLETLERLGIKAGYYLPERCTDGYGLKTEALISAREKGYSLIVTVDCGITSLEEAAWARQQGLELIITDHHRPGADLPTAIAVVNPWLGPDPSPLCGAGVAFKLAQALAKHFSLPQQAGIDAGWVLDLVALGTIADAVPLLGENRLLVQLGLKALAQSKRPGLKALAEVAGLPAREWTSQEVAFRLIPRLNACGRMGKADPGLELLITSSPQQALELAQQLQRENRARRLLEDHIATEAKAMASEAITRGVKGLALASQDWHPGVIGIVAARLVEQFNRPVVLIALAGDKGQGSGRTVPGVNLYEALGCCRSHLLAFGGHTQAAGLEIEARNVAPFQAAFNEAVQAAMAAAPAAAPVLPEAEVLLSQLDWRLLEELESLAPFGEGNPRPLLLYRNGYLKEARQVGNNGAHLKLTVSAEGQEVAGIGFNLQLPPQLLPGDAADLAFYLDRNVYQGREELQLLVQAVRPAGRTGSNKVICGDWVAATREVTPAPTWCRQLLEILNNSSPPEGILFSSGVAVSQCYFALKRFISIKPLRPLGPWLGKAGTAKAEGRATGLITCSPFCSEAIMGKSFLFSPLIAGDQERWGLLQPALNTWNLLPDLQAILKELLERKRRVLVYERDLNNMKRLAAWLQEQFPYLNLVIDAFVDSRHLLLAHQETQSGRLPLMVARRGLPAWYYPAEAVIFNYLPSNQEEVELALPLVDQVPEVYIRTEMRDRPAIDLRRELTRFYRWIQHKASNSRGLYIFNNKGYHQRCYLAILEELDLIRVESRKEGLAINILEVSSRRDLLASRRFQQLLAEAELAYKFHQQIKAGGDNCGPEGTGATD